MSATGSFVPIWNHEFVDFYLILASLTVHAYDTLEHR
jgi:hypothetical protein